MAARPAAPGGADLCFVWDGPIERPPVTWRLTGSSWRRGRSRATAAAARARASTSATPTAACSSSSRTREAAGHDARGRAAAAVVAGADWVIRFRPPRWILIAAFDHPAHLATAGADRAQPARRARRAGTPASWRGRCCPMWTTSRSRSPSEQPTPGTTRPATHCLRPRRRSFALAACSGSELDRAERPGARSAHVGPRRRRSHPGAPLLASPFREARRPVPYAPTRRLCCARAQPASRSCRADPDRARPLPFARGL